MKLKEPLNQPYIANPSPSLNDGKAEISIPGHRLVSFDHMLDGSRIFCSCSQVTHEKMKARAQSVVAGYVAGSWPQKTLQLLGDATYQDSICHLCIARGSGAAAAALRYGDNVQAFEESYIDQFTIGLDMDARTAKAEVQQQLSLSRWKSEAELFAIIKKLFAGTIVQREASPAWLGRQRLDIYLPDLSLAIEYQGQQHFQAVALFGGEQGTRRAMERDALKQQLCQENGVSLIQVLHSDALTLPSIRHRLRRYLPQSV